MQRTCFKGVGGCGIFTLHPVPVGLYHAATGLSHRTVADDSSGKYDLVLVHLQTGWNKTSQIG